LTVERVLLSCNEVPCDRQLPGQITDMVYIFWLEDIFTGTPDASDILRT